MGKVLFKFSEDADLGENPISDDSLDFGDSSSDETLSDSLDFGSLSGGGGGGSPDLEAEDSPGKVDGVDSLSDPYENFVSINIETYVQLENDIETLFTEVFNSSVQFKNSEEVYDYFYSRLSDLGWSLDALKELSFGDIKNLNSLFIEKIKNREKVTDDLDLFSILKKIHGGQLNMSQKVKLSMKDGKVTKVVAEGPDNVENKLETLKNRVSSQIVRARRSIKDVRLSVNAANGILFKRNKFAESDEEVKEEEVEEVNTELADQATEVGSNAQDLEGIVKELMEAIKDLTKAVQGMSPDEISKSEDDEIAGLIDEGREIADEGYDALGDVDGLAEEIKASLNGKAKKAARAKKAYSFDDGSVGEPSPENISAEPVPNAAPAPTEELAMGGDIKSVAEQLDSGVSASSLSAQLDPIVNRKQAGELLKLLSNPSAQDELFSYVMSVAGASSEGVDMPIAANSNGEARKAGWTELYKDIGETSKVMDDGSGNAVAEDISKGFSQGNSKMNQDTKQYPENFGQKYGDPESPLSAPNVKPKHAFSQEQKLKIRKSAEIAFEEQFKHIIENPLSVAIAKEFMRKGHSEDEAIKSAFNILSESMEETVKVALKSAFAYMDLDESSLIRKAKNVAVYKISLGLEDETRVASETSKVEAKETRNPVLKTFASDSSTENKQAEAIFQKMAQ